MQIQFSAEIDNFIQSQVDSGAYASPDELVSKAVRLLMTKQPQEWTPEALRAALAVGAEQADRGEFVNQTMDEMFAEIIAELEQRHS